MIGLRTIRSRLIAGFGASIGLLLLAGTVGWYGLSRSNAQADDTVRALADRSEFTERASTTILRELVAGLRYLNSGAPADQQQYLQLVDQAYDAADRGVWPEHDFVHGYKLRRLSDRELGPVSLSLSLALSL